METKHSEKRRGGVLESRIASPYPGANHVAPPAAKDEKEYRTTLIFLCLETFELCHYPPRQKGEK